MSVTDPSPDGRLGFTGLQMTYPASIIVVGADSSGCITAGDDVRLDLLSPSRPGENETDQDPGTTPPTLTLPSEPSYGGQTNLPLLARNPMNYTEVPSDREGAVITVMLQCCRANSSGVRQSAWFNAVDVAGYYTGSDVWSVDADNEFGSGGNVRKAQFLMRSTAPGCGGGGPYRLELEFRVATALRSALASGGYTVLARLIACRLDSYIPVGAVVIVT